MTLKIIPKVFPILLSVVLISCKGGYESLTMDPKEIVTKKLTEAVENSETPAVQYMFISPDSVLYEFNYGLADIKNHLSIDHSTSLNGFSTTKTFTAIAILQLQENNKIDIDEPISNYLDYYPYDKEMTIKQVLNHTSGLPNPNPLKWSHLKEEDEEFDYQNFLTRVINENNELENEPGEKFAYSNIGYLLLGEVVRKVSGLSYKEYIQKNIISRLNLDEKDYMSFSIPEGNRHAKGYIKKWSFLNLVLNFMIDKDKYIEDSYDGWSQFRNFYIDGMAYGGIISNAGGFSKYLQAILKEDVLLNELNKKEMFTIQRTNDNKQTEMALGWFGGDLEETRYFTHAGGGGGYYCEIRIYPDIKLASVILFNRTGVSREGYLDNIDIYFVKEMKRTPLVTEK